MMLKRTLEADDKDALVQLRIPAKLKAQAEARAKKQGMTLSRLIRTLLEEELADPKLARALRTLRNEMAALSERKDEP
jgi:antitoxin component of RelBE/YafQ-DinJ toxin-antitoxin module